MKRFNLLFTLFLINVTLITNGQEKKDTTSILNAFRKGKIEGHFRSFFMSTNNDEPLTDYYALAFGGGLKYQTESFKGFQFGIGGSFAFNLTSSDLTIPDPTTRIMNRYEIGLFDQTNPTNKKDLQRLEDLYAKYNFRKSSVKYGKQNIKTPFINPQDGRMNSTVVQGAWIEVNELKKTKIEIGWLSHISPRSTVKWYDGASSIGIYPSGVAINGIKSDYKDQLDSKGIAIAGVTYSLNEQIKLRMWDHWVENIFNTVFLQVDGEFSMEGNRKIIAGAQYIHQQAVSDGGNADPAKTYFDPSQKVNIYGVRAGLELKEATIRLNYSRITNEGRFLFPREWGREPLFTFLPRERNEGLGDVNAISVNFFKSYFRQKLKAEISAGYYELPDVKDTRLNKYGLPSYYQFNLDLKYSFSNFLDGLSAELLYLYKMRNGNIYEDLRYVIHKTEMQQINIIINYNF
ncbi:MAG TPA: OprD family outer membrane porin [Chitinophagaceae bacterium]